MKRCCKCIMPETRPRLEFNSNGVCAACEWHEIKKSIDWGERERQLQEIVDSIRGKHKYDCIVPVSGGKDSTYVADKMKNKYNLNVLTVTIAPPLETQLIQKNLDNFLKFGFDNIKVTPNPLISQKINKFGFVDQGRPLLSWTTCLNTVMFQTALEYNIPLIMFGEEGETEYGGTTELRYTPYYDIDFAIKVYTYGNDFHKFLKFGNERELALWKYPSKEELKKADFKVAHYSYFENWDSFKHYKFAAENYNMECAPDRNTGTYTQFGQLDTPLYKLHTYMMYLKFGFGRCLQDACIDIRGGRITREQAIELVKKYDGEYIADDIPLFLDYYKMSESEFLEVIDKHANKDLFEKRNGLWTPRFDIK